MKLLFTDAVNAAPQFHCCLASDTKNRIRSVAFEQPDAFLISHMLRTVSVVLLLILLPKRKKKLVAFASTLSDHCAYDNKNDTPQKTEE